MVEPAAVYDAGGNAVKSDYVVGGEEAIEEETDHACNSMFNQVIHRVVDADPEFDCKGLAKWLDPEESMCK